jgi:hypothetical protein
VNTAPLDGFALGGAAATPLRFTHIVGHSVGMPGRPVAAWAAVKRQVAAAGTGDPAVVRLPGRVSPDYTSAKAE